MYRKLQSDSVSDSLVTVGVPRAADDSGQTEQSDTVQYLTTPEKTQQIQMMPKRCLYKMIRLISDQ